MAKKIFTNKITAVLAAILAMFVWGCAYSFIKLGMAEFSISDGDLGSKMVFAGWRFFIAGLITLLLAFVMKQSLRIESKADFSIVLLFGLVNTGLHYLFSYIALSYCTGTKASLIDSLGSFWLILFSTFFFKEKFTSRRAIGCLLGFSGIIITNLGGSVSGGFTFLGEGMMILNTLCAAFGGVLTKFATRRVNPMAATGYSLSFGGFLLLALGYLLNGRSLRMSIRGFWIMAALVAISAIGFILYNELLCYNPAGKIAIFNVLIPVFGTLMSCLLLKESFHLKYLIALIVISLGILAVNSEPALSKELSKETEEELS
jgi:drug/metabolite transporter (DMT)-like permease